MTHVVGCFDYIGVARGLLIKRIRVFLIDCFSVFGLIGL